MVSANPMHMLPSLGKALPGELKLCQARLPDTCSVDHPILYPPSTHPHLACNILGSLLPPHECQSISAPMWATETHPPKINTPRYLAVRRSMSSSYTQSSSTHLAILYICPYPNLKPMYHHLAVRRSASSSSTRSSSTEVGPSAW